MPNLIQTQIFALPSDQEQDALKHTYNHVDCPACDRPELFSMGYDPDSLLSQKFSVAAAHWLLTRKPYLKERSYYMVAHHIDQLNKFLADVPMDKMHIGHLRQYQLARMANTDARWKRMAKSSIINHEMSVVQMILKRAGLWKRRFSLHYEPIPKPPTRPKKTMTDREEDNLFQIASSNPDWELAYTVASITNNTSAAGTELRHLRLENLYLDNPYPTFLIPAEFAKNDNRGRRIYVNETCMTDFRRALAMAEKKGSTRPEHYLFPKRVVRGLWDPYKPASASWLRNQFRDMRDAAGLPWLTPHCLRHQIITRLFEEGHSEQDIQSITGQLSREALKLYSHNRIERQRSVLHQDDPRNRKRVEAARIGASREVSGLQKMAI
jgi:integrase